MRRSWLISFNLFCILPQCEDKAAAFCDVFEHVLLDLFHKVTDDKSDRSESNKQFLIDN